MITLNAKTSGLCRHYGRHTLSSSLLPWEHAYAEIAFPCRFDDERAMQACEWLSARAEERSFEWAWIRSPDPTIARLQETPSNTGYTTFIVSRRESDILFELKMRFG